MLSSKIFYWVEIVSGKGLQILLWTSLANCSLFQIETLVDFDCFNDCHKRYLPTKFWDWLLWTQRKMFVFKK